jgi:predicted GIY-YIG superfamily endonuclease
MITVYVIESLVDQTWYTGMAKNAINRLREYTGGRAIQFALARL